MGPLFSLIALMLMYLCRLAVPRTVKHRAHSDGMYTVYIYEGEGAGEGSVNMLTDALVTLCDRKYYHVRHISPQEIKQGGWQDDAAILALGGGYDLGYISALGEEGTRQIRDYVHRGGSYIGFCAGAYFASHYIEFDKGGPLEVTGERDLKFFPGSCIGPVFPGFEYGTEKGAHASLIDWVSTENRRPSSSFHCYFNGGGRFITSDNTGHSIMRGNTTTILGKYSEIFEESNNAVLVSSVGEGIAILSGVHLEYNPYLLPTDDPYLNENDILLKLKADNAERIERLRELLQILGLKVIDIKSAT